MDSLEKAKKLSEDIYLEANKLLAHTKLVELLSQFGEVDLGGSYSYDLMVDRDLDFGVVINKVDSNFKSKLASLFASQEWVYGMTISDRVNFEPLSNLSAPRGLFLGLTIPFPVERWNIDVWFLVTDKVPKDDIAKLIEKATDEQKDTILQIKYELLTSGNKQKGITSAEVYRSVLEQKIKDTEGYLKLLQQS